jgi:hypothetical protein
MQETKMDMSNARRVEPSVRVAEFISTERAVCELCGDVVSTVGGGRHTGLGFVPFERLLDLHMEKRHPNVCVLPVRDEWRKAA